VTRHLVFCRSVLPSFSYYNGNSPSGFCLDNAPSSFLLLLIRRPVTSPLRSGGIYHFFRTHTYSPYRPSVPISLMVPLAFTINFYEGYGPFMTVRTTLNKHITCLDVGFMSGSRRPFRGLNCRSTAPFLEAVPCKSSILPATLDCACAASVLALFLTVFNFHAVFSYVCWQSKMTLVHPAVRD
jgi:hypothetical protein